MGTTTWLMVGAAVLVVAMFVMSKVGVGNTNLPKWRALAAMVNGTASISGLKGTYDGRAVESRISSGGGNARGPSAGNWDYEIKLNTGSTGQGQNWQIFHYEGEWRSDPAGQALKDQMQSGPASSLLEQAGFQKLVYKSKSGELVGTSSHVIQAGLSDSLSDISKTISNQPVPTSDQFKAQLDLLAWIAKQQPSAPMQNH